MWQFTSMINQSYMTTFALLMPLMAVAESHSESGAATPALLATAHLNFKIVIPKVLSMQVAGEGDRIAGAQMVAVRSTGRNVTMNATILTAAARRSLAQDTPCRRGDAHGGPVVCTASMP
jgi:hypothetical protein